MFTKGTTIWIFLGDFFGATLFIFSCKGTGYFFLHFYYAVNHIKWFWIFIFNLIWIGHEKWYHPFVMTEYFIEKTSWPLIFFYKSLIWQETGPENLQYKAKMELGFKYQFQNHKVWFLFYEMFLIDRHIGFRIQRGICSAH